MNTHLRVTTATLFLMAIALFGTSLVAAQSDDPLPLPGVGTVLVTNTSFVSFDTPDSWENYFNPNGAELTVENGTYRAYTPNPGYLWGLNTQEHTDVVVEVQITPMTIFQDVGAGIMCRADTSNNGDGYYFMINPNGYYSIQKGQGTGFVALIDWQPSRAVHAGIDNNTIRAACIDDQLAMYVNDQLVATVTDTTYSSGYAGLAVAAGANSVDMTFDDVTLYDVEVPSHAIIANPSPSDAS